MWRRLLKLGHRAPAFKPGPPPALRLVLTESCIAGLQPCLEPEIRKGHEALGYLLGQSDGTTTLAVSVVRPQAATTPGSVSVNSPAVARVVRLAVDRGLQLVGQVHTHPGEAYHSAGDDAGARIAYSGYVSIVFPHYGRHLPALDGAAGYMYRGNTGFTELAPSRIVVVPGTMP